MAVRKKLYAKFNSFGASSQTDGTATSGTNTESNYINIDGVNWEYFVIGTQTTLRPGPAASGEGGDWTMTDTNGQGKILVPGGNTLLCPYLYTIGTDPAFYCELQVQVTDWSGTQLFVGFHGGAATIQALTGTWANYTDKAAIGNYAGGADPMDCYTSTALNNAGDVDTDTTINFTDGDVAKLKVMVSDAGVVTYSLSLAPTAAPTTFVDQTLTTVAYTFDDGDVVVPFIHMLSHTDTATLIEFNHFIVDFQNS